MKNKIVEPRPIMSEYAIINAESFLLRVPVRPLQVDSQSTIEAWDVLAVKLELRSGIVGWGYQCGFGPAMASAKAFIDNAILPEIVGMDARMHKAWWPNIYIGRHHIGLNGPSFQGISAPEIAAWDATAKGAGVPLWMMLGGKCRDKIRAYNTNCGWLGYPEGELVDKVKHAVDNGFSGVKVKIGSPNFSDDIKRLEAVRTAVGDDIYIATDVNNKWDLTTALRNSPVLDELNAAWLEEPLYPFDVFGHAELASSIATPLLHGENIYEPLMFRDMIDAGAIGILQPSNMKLGGIGRWLEAAGMARTAGIRIVPAGWTMMQIDQHLAAATPECWMIEWIPWMREIFVEPVRFEDGYVIVSDTPGAGTAIRDDVVEKYAL